jgi:hypothetical protein
MIFVTINSSRDYLSKGNTTAVVSERSISSIAKMLYLTGMSFIISYVKLFEKIETTRILVYSSNTLGIFTQLDDEKVLDTGSYRTTMRLLLNGYVMFQFALEGVGYLQTFQIDGTGNVINISTPYNYSPILDDNHDFFVINDTHYFVAYKGSNYHGFFKIITSDGYTAPSTSTGYIYTQGAWKTISNVYVFVNGFWKQRSGVYTNIQGVWKS